MFYISVPKITQYIPELKSMTERKNDIIIELGTLPRKIKTHAVVIRHSSIFDFKKFLRNFVIIYCLKKVSKTPKTLQDTVKPKLR